MTLSILEENEILKKENKELKKNIDILQDKIRELMQSFGKDKTEDGGPQK